MLYPRKNDPKLTRELFENPTSEYRGTPFWAWNCALEKDELLRQLDVFRKMGLGGAHMHVRTGLETPYLSDEYMALIRTCVDKCRDEKMLAWLYDEDRWPSGAAGGLVTKDEQHRARHLLFTATPYGQGNVIHGNDSRSEGLRSENGRFLACYDVELDENGCLARYAQIDQDAPAKGRKWYAYLETDMPSPWYNGQTYANTLSKDTIRKFVEVTHERYKQAVGDAFGTTIPAIFTDEPQFSRKSTLPYAREVRDVTLPWTDDLDDTYRTAYGEGLISHLPELIWELPDHQCSLTRYRYHDHVSERFASAFADTCGDWCRENGLMLTGHMMEEPTLQSQTEALGDCMRSYRSFQLPGIDMLCNRYEFTTAKQAQSAAHQYGRDGVLSELYGVTGWHFDFRGHKLQGDWQAALGVTVRVPHLSWVSMKGEAKRDYPASINYQSPWWQDYSYVENHFARVNTALTRGKPLVRVGVIHPVESYWLHWGPTEQTCEARTQMDENFQNVTDWLCRGGIDFNFISEALLPSQCKQGGAPLQVGQMAYDAIVVPGCETLRSTTLERLEAFKAAGGRLIFLGDAPLYENALPSRRGKQLYDASIRTHFTKGALLESLSPVRVVDFRDSYGRRSDRFVHQLRRDHDSIWLFMAQGQPPVYKDIPEFNNIRIYMEGTLNVTLYDTLTGQITPLACFHENGRTVIHRKFYEQDSLLLRFDPVAAPSAVPATPVQRWSAPKPVDPLSAYTLSEPNVLLLDKAEFALDDGPWQKQTELLRADNVLRTQLGWPTRGNSVVQPWVIPEEPLTHKARLRFCFRSLIPVRGARLALEDAKQARVAVNGTPVNAAPDGYFTDRAIGTLPLPDMPDGENIIEVTLPFGKRTNIEWCYLLGTFGVDMQGEERLIVPLPDKLGYDCITRQKLPHYGGNVTYHIPVETSGGDLLITLPQYEGAALRITLDGKEQGHIAFSPNQLTIRHAAPGAHMLDVTLLGHRHNCFGPMHHADLALEWIGPDAWRTANTWWTESYRLKPLGIFTAPLIRESDEP